VVVGGVGAVLEARGATWLPWVAAGVVAVSFAPLRNALQQAANKMTYGQWSQPAEVLASTGRRLADAVDVPGLLHTLVEELGRGLGLAHVAVADARGTTLATTGTPGRPEDELPLTAYGVPVGSLRWARKPLRPADRDLLADLAHQLGGVLHAATLLEVVREAQERTVVGREEERRRLRRDLHDGLGPALAALTLQVDTLRNRAAAGRADLDLELLRVRSGIQETVADVRRIVDGLRPPALDELGLQGALEDLAARFSLSDAFEVDVRCDPLPPLVAAVEVAAFRVVQEALTNAAKHGLARHAEVRLALADGSLEVCVHDDGVGLTGPRPGGVGLVSMRERAEEIGGSLAVVPGVGGGTCVRALLPLVGPTADQQPTTGAAW
jgi:signal transduction histidine kinase